MNPRDLLVEMFSEMTIKKDLAAIERYYHPDFSMTTNGQTQDYAAVVAGHRNVYATAIEYAIRYDDEAWVVTDDRVAGRLWITTSRPGETPTELEVIIVATAVDGLLHRVWELTWPDWSQVKALENYGSGSD